MRLNLKSAGSFREVEFGWDPGVNGFFLQCFEETSDDPPSVWLPSLPTVNALQDAMFSHGLQLHQVVADYLRSADLSAQGPLPSADHPVWNYVD
jgi:hypothetical protein